MKKITIYTLFTFFVISCKSQIVEQKVILNEVKREFKNQGELQNYWAEKIFEEKYTDENYEIFSGKIEVLSKTCFKFDDKILEVWNTDEELKLIFEKGIFYPNILIGNTYKDPLKTELELDKLTHKEKVFYVKTRIDTLRISNLQELVFLNKPPKVRRYNFLYYRKNSMNPQLYYIELMNEKATDKTSNKDFIQNSKLTFCKAGSILL